MTDCQVCVWLNKSISVSDRTLFWNWLPSADGRWDIRWHCVVISPSHFCFFSNCGHCGNSSCKISKCLYLLLLFMLIYVYKKKNRLRWSHPIQPTALFICKSPAHKGQEMFLLYVLYAHFHRDEFPSHHSSVFSDLCPREFIKVTWAPVVPTGRLSCS